MSAQSNKALIEQYLDALRRDKSTATLDTYISEELLKEHIAMYDSALPGYWLEAEDIVAEGDKVVVRGNVRGVHNGPLMGIEPTGKEVTVPFFITYRIENGKIADHWMLVDSMSLMQQIGALPSPSST